MEKVGADTNPNSNRGLQDRQTMLHGSTANMIGGGGGLSNGGIPTPSHIPTNDKRALEREALRNVIVQWNANRLDLFELSEPNENLEFHGVMRFYFQDSITGRAATKCVRVASDATAEDVIATLVEKFRPDMRMLTPAGSAAGQYALYEVHGQGQNGGVARKLEPDEKPLLVQLNWHIDDRDGRFLLKNIDDEHNTLPMTLNDTTSSQSSSFRRKLSKREKKQLKKEKKKEAAANDGKNNVAEKLYNELPETSFTRSISNPEAVMRRRRQQKFEKKLQAFRSKDGGPDTGGTLKIYGEALCPDVPYKTLLLSVRDCATKVVREMLNKYGLNDDGQHWCLVQTIHPNNGGEQQEFILDDDECPLAILMNHSNSSGSIMFHVRRRPTDSQPRKRKKKPGIVGIGSGPSTSGIQGSTSSGSVSNLHRGGPNAPGGQSGTNDHGYHHHRRMSDVENVPMLVELGADQSSESFRTVRITGDVLEVGSANGIGLQLYGPHIQPRHCIIQYNVDSGVTTITPSHVDAITTVNGQRINQTTILQHGSIVKFGRLNSYRFLDPSQENKKYSLNDNNLSVYDRSPTRLKDNTDIPLPSPTSSNPMTPGYQTKIASNIPTKMVPPPSTHKERALSPVNLQPPPVKNHLQNIGNLNQQTGNFNQSSNQINGNFNQQNGNFNQQNGNLNLPNNYNQQNGNFNHPNYNQHFESSRSSITSSNSNLLNSPQKIKSKTPFQHPHLAGTNLASHFRGKDDFDSSGGHAGPSYAQNGGPNIGPYSQGDIGYKDNYETTFDLDGNVETISMSSYNINKDVESKSNLPENLRYPQQRHAGGQDAILPAVLEFPETHQDLTLARIITQLDPTTIPTFKLAPAYTLYLCARYRASTHYRPDLQPTERAHKLTLLMQHVANLIQNVIQERYNDSQSQTFWLANSLELLHFLKSDRHISAFSLSAQETLAECVQLAFNHLIVSETNDLIPCINVLLTQEQNDLTSVNPLITNLSRTMSLLCHSRVNAAITIQLFSQLFHYISARCLNIIFNQPSLCSKKWGQRLTTRLMHISRWAESQGLELAAECHLTKLQQLAILLQAPKQTAEDIANLPSTCFKLNSVQLGTVLSQYQSEPSEAVLDPSLVAQAVSAAQTLADELILADGKEVRLREQPTLSQALLLPEDGYTCDVVRGVPPGLAEFLRTLQPPCRLASQPTSAGSWTVYMHQHSQGLRSPSAMSNRSGGPPPQLPPQPDIQVIKLHKSSGGMGLSIVAAKGVGQERLGIYIKSVVPGGAADTDGRLEAGDQLLRVDNQSLIDITQERAAEYLVRTGPVVTLEVAKQGAIYHGLATLLQQPSPPISRGPRRLSERDIPSTSNFKNTYQPGAIAGEIDQHHIGGLLRNKISSSKSVPALHQVGNQEFYNPPKGAATLPSNPSSMLGITKQGSTGQTAIFNPGYSRTSSNGSIGPNIPENSLVPPVKSKSIHNLVSPNIGSIKEDQGFYQNLSVYRKDHDMRSATRNSQNIHHPINNQANILNSPTRPSSAYYGNNPLQSPTLRHYPNQSNSVHHLPNAAAYPVSKIDYGDQRGYPPNLKSSQSQSILAQPYQQYSPTKKHSTSMNALARGQAKIAEISEEIRRRQTRPGNAQQHYAQNLDEYRLSNNNQSIQNIHQVQGVKNQYDIYSNQIYSNGNQTGYYPEYYKGNGGHMLPPVAPKPNQIQNLKQIDERDNLPTPPPPVPPTSTHPLYSAATFTEPPKGHFFPTKSTQETPLVASNPWEREEREREKEMRREAARQWRDRQIADLSALTNRTPQQEEQLRALKLERDFQRRAEESAALMDEDENSVVMSYSPHNNLAKQQNNEHNLEQNNNLAIATSQNPKFNTNVVHKPERPSDLSINTSQTPTSILKNNESMNQINTNMQSLSLSARQEKSTRLPTIDLSSPKSLNTPSPPPPPERGSSYLAMSLRANTTNSQVPQQVQATSTTNKSDTKRVSFNDDNSTKEIKEEISSPCSTMQNNNTLNMIREDPNKFIDEAESLLATPTTPTDTLIAGATPGVIGAQEFYRDPRTRRLAEKEAQSQDNKNQVVPEKLSFKEKMKMFAMETGEPDTPKDRSKISRAQRDIDNIVTPGNNNNNNSTPETRSNNKNFSLSNTTPVKISSN